MKGSMIIKTVAALAIAAGIPIAAQAAKTMTERGVTEKVSAPRMQFAHN